MGINSVQINIQMIDQLTIAQITLLPQRRSGGSCTTFSSANLGSSRNSSKSFWRRCRAVELDIPTVLTDLLEQQYNHLLVLVVSTTISLLPSLHRTSADSNQIGAAAGSNLKNASAKLDRKLLFRFLSLTYKSYIASKFYRLFAMIPAAAEELQLTGMIRGIPGSWD